MVDLEKIDPRWVQAAIDKAAIDQEAEKLAFKLYCKRSGEKVTAEALTVYLLQRLTMLSSAK